MAHYEVIRPARASWPARAWQALRSITFGPYSTKDRELARIFGGTPAISGVHVDEESSMGFSGVWNAMTLISQDVAKVPLPLYRRLPDGGKEAFREHPLYELLHDEPNEEMSSFKFRSTLQGHVLVWGNGYAEIERDASSRPVALWPLMPWSVTPFRDQAQKLRYRVRQPSGRDIEFDKRDMLHLSGIGLDGISGYPPIRKAMESIGLGMATERFGAAFFGNGATFGGIIKYPVGIATNPLTREENRNEIAKRHQGVDRSHRLLTLYEGAEYQQMGIPPEQAQFLETRRFQIEEVARWFNIPVHKLKELARSTNNNIEHQGIEYATDTLQPWFRMWEGELRLKLVPRLERKIQFFEHITEALTRGDSAAQGQLIREQFYVGGISPNEIRGKFNMNPRPDGTDIYVPSNTMPAELARKYWEAQIDLATANAERARKPEPEPTSPPVAGRTVDVLEEQLALARHATSLAEELRDKAQADLTRLQELIVLKDAAHDTTVEELERGLATAEQKLESVIGARRDALAQVEAADAARSDALLKLETALTTMQAAGNAKDVAIAERDVAQQAHDEARRQLAEARVVSQETAAALEQTRQQLAEQTVVLDAERTDRQTFVAVAEAERASLQQGVADVTAISAALRAKCDETSQHLATAVQTLETERQQRQAQRAATLASMRSLFVDASERLLQKESDRARKHQATAEKLRAWVDTFYPMHVETVRHAFRPIVGAWVAVTGQEAGDLLERLVSEHGDKSKRDMMHVLDADDEDMRAALLERTLRRWEEERADAMADALVREGMAQHG